MRDLTGGAGVQHVLEVGGKDTLAKALSAVGPGGQIALIGGLRWLRWHDPGAVTAGRQHHGERDVRWLA